MPPRDDRSGRVEIRYANFCSPPLPLSPSPTDTRSLPLPFPHSPSRPARLVTRKQLAMALARANEGRSGLPWLCGKSPEPLRLSHLSASARNSVHRRAVRACVRTAERHRSVACVTKADAALRATRCVRAGMFWQRGLDAEQSCPASCRIAAQGVCAMQRAVRTQARTTLRPLCRFRRDRLSDRCWQ